MKNKMLYAALLMGSLWVAPVFAKAISEQPLFEPVPEASAETGAEASGPSGPLTLYVVRHGQTIFNLMDRVQGVSDGILTAKGIEGAVNMGKGLKDVPFSAVYSSDLSRARETARLALKQNQATAQWTIQEMPELREVSFGIFEGDPNWVMYAAFAEDLGLTVPEDAKSIAAAAAPILAHYDGDMKRFFEGLADFNKRVDTEYGIAESAEEVYDRLDRGLAAIIEENPAGGNVMLVAHGQSISFLFARLGVEMPGGGGLANSSVTKLVYDYAEKTFTVDGPVGDLSYLEAGAAESREAEEPPKDETSAWTPSEDGSVTFYVTRHGKTMFNTVHRVQGWSDTPLTPAGLEVAEQLGRGLKAQGIRFNAAWSSDLGRARETARLVLETSGNTGLALQETSRFRESCFGIYEGDTDENMWGAAGIQLGLEAETVEEAYKALLAAMTEGQYALPDMLGAVKALDTTGLAEDYDTVKARMQQQFTQLAEEYAAKGGGNILMVAHGISILAMISDWTTEQPEGGQLANASVTKVVYQDGTFTVTELNNMAYVEAGAAL
ncbi:MAG: histidine phosphatase family protein [Spirochaetaceae bacterium]|jgi:probable phosphoglycerate mutase|nr:histidine phosphatase family protein [Spirochaetaceae bacterium]